ncbi:MAG: hypothetical protein JNJ57_00190, partial [Saprospiraceae bacterium]|nr:hypothetical protein [Saprospiraceae bacterium]
FKEDEFKSGHSEQEAFTELWEEIEPKENNYPPGINVKIPFALMAGRQSQAASLFTLNMICATYEENKDALTWLLQNNINICGIELGNETYLKVHDSIFPTVEAYIAKAKDWTARLRQDFPGYQIGIVSAPVRVDANGAWFKSWNDAIAREDFFDAISLHHYVRFDACGYDEFSTDTWNCVRDSMVREAQERLPAILDEWRNKMPGKKLWLTEWNVSAHRKPYLNSQMTNLYNSAYLLQLARYSAKNQGFVSIAHHHNLLAAGPFAIMGPDINNQSYFDKCERRAGFLAFAYLRDVFDGNSSWVDGAALFHFKNWDRKPIAEAFLHTETNGKKSLMVVVVNPYETVFNLEWNQNEPLDFKVGNNHYSTNMTGLLSGFKGETLQSGQTDEQLLQRVNESFQGNVVAPPLSVLVLRLPL